MRWLSKKSAILHKLKSNEIMFSIDKVCICMTGKSTEVADELSSNQEGADTKLLLHANHALSAQPNKAVLIGSQAGGIRFAIKHG